MGKEVIAVFCVDVREYLENKHFCVTDQASLDAPKSYAVMFVMQNSALKLLRLRMVEHCLVFCEKGIEVPADILENHAVVFCDNARLEYSRFFRDNGIRNLPGVEEFEMVRGAMIAKGAVIGENTVIMPGAYVSGETRIGANSYIGSGVRLVGKVTIGDACIVRENSVIGADGLSTDRDIDGRAISMPQFGGVVIGNRVEIGALTVIARGAIDDTIIGDGCKIDNASFISHNVHLGKDSFVVGESILFGSVTTGERAYISGNATIRNKIQIGKDAFVGMGAVVTKDIPDATTVAGNPARVKN